MAPFVYGQPYILQFLTAVMASSLALWFVLFTGFVTMTLLRKFKQKCYVKHCNNEAARTTLFILAFFFLSVFFIILSTFYLIPWWASAILSFATIFIATGFSFFKLVPKFLEKDSKKKRKKSHYIFFGTVLALSIIIAVFFSWFFSSMCFMFHPTEVTFAGTRVGLSDTCLPKSPKPCHVYLHFGSDTSSQMMVIFHSSKKYQNPTVWITGGNSSSISNYQEFPAEAYHFDRISAFTTRYIYYGALTNLNSASDYYFFVGDSSDPNSMDFPFSVKKFRTGPSTNDSTTEFNFAIGGDVGYDANGDFVRRTTAQAALTEPLFLALGGDIGYANAIPGCYHRWDLVLDALTSNMVTPKGYFIPFITSIGNHEAGVPYGVVEKNSANFYYAYFPWEKLSQRTPYELTSYHAHNIGADTTLIAVDSAITTQPTDQIPFLEQTLSSKLGKNKKNFVFYHIPIYPVVRDPNGVPMKYLRSVWEPVWNKNNIKIAFEHHDHAYVRTKRISAGIPDPMNGTLYLGDGAYAVLNPLAADTMQREYVEQAKAVMHFMNVVVSEFSVNVTAISIDGDKFDNVTIS